ncbi:MAG: hypothetical protein H0V89_08820 [Deltaproteobacteria bacterium]|nr:hypothetical protein [Deltaproteobacteria bacterium]
MKHSILVLGPLLALGCKDKEVGDGSEQPSVTDTGWFTGETPNCTATVSLTEPAADEGGWFWRDAPRVFVTESDTAGFTAVLTGPTGEIVPTEIVWGTGLDFHVTFDGGLEPDADHVLEVTDCSGTTEVPFHTGTYGMPVTGGASSLSGNTYQLDLVGAEWVQPSGLGPLLVGFFTTPILLGVSFADDDFIDLLGAPGFTDVDGELQQDDSTETWDFPLVSFEQSPFVIAYSDNVVFEFSDVPIPIDDFGFETTFSADGTSLGGTVINGVADTRGLGVLLDDPDPNAICLLAETFGTYCIPCSDALPYCLVMEVRDVDGTLVSGLTLHTVD